MTLSPGTRLGAYTIDSLLGAGGMGEVYRARDSRLDRDVAIRVLRAELATDRDRLSRFGREAKLLAALYFIPPIDCARGRIFDESRASKSDNPSSVASPAPFIPPIRQPD